MTYINQSYNNGQSLDNAAGAVITGQVTSYTSGAAVSGATVTVHESGSFGLDAELPTAIKSCLTDRGGNYSLTLNQPITSEVISAQKEGYSLAIATQDINVPAMITKNFQIQEAPACIDGVANDGEKPISGVNVTATFGRVGAFISNPQRDKELKTVTDGNGRFQLKNVPIGRVHLITSGFGFLPHREFANATASPCARVEIKLDKARSVSLIILNAKREPIARAFAIGSWGQTTADEHGKMFVFAGEDDVVRCQIGARGYEQKDLAFDMEKAPSTVVLDDAVSFRGLVLSDTGSPIPDALVYVTQTGGSARTGRISPEPAKTDPNGQFEFPLFVNKVYELRVVKSGFVENRIRYEDKPAPDFVEIHLETPNSGFFGKALDSHGNPIKRLLVKANDDSKGISYHREFKDDEGNFSVFDIPAGVYSVSLQSSSAYALFSAHIPEITVRNGYFYGPVLVPMSELPGIKK